MLDQILTAFLSQFPLAAVVGVALWIVYRDGRADRQYMMDLLTKLYIMKIEERGETEAEHEKTLMSRP